mgnify:FL=1
MAYDLELSTSREKWLGKLCYGLSQGAKLAETDNPYKIGQHTAAMRHTILWMVKQHPEDFQSDLVQAMAEAGVELNLEPDFNEGPKP